MARIYIIVCIIFKCTFTWSQLEKYSDQNHPFTTVRVAGDDRVEVFADGVSLGRSSHCSQYGIFNMSRDVKVIAAKLSNNNDGQQQVGEFILSVDSGLTWTDERWKCDDLRKHLHDNSWKYPGYDDSNWANAYMVRNVESTCLHEYSKFNVTITQDFFAHLHPNAQCIWWSTNLEIVCRYRYQDPCYTQKPCRNGGLCYPYPQGNNVKCDCSLTGFRGAHCDEGCGSNPCQHGGSCHEEGLNLYTCTCPAGYIGVHCETEPSACNSSPCQHGGTCTSLSTTGGFTCHCHEFFIGPHCETDRLRSTGELMANMVQCEEKMSGRFLCMCAAGYTGVDCSASIDDCASDPCPPLAKCVDSVNRYFCRCEPGLQPEACNTTCLAGTFGNDCSYNCHCLDHAPCNPETGRCPDGKCEKGYTGDMCSIYSAEQERAVSGEGTADEGLPMWLIGSLCACVATIGLLVGAVIYRKKSKKKAEEVHALTEEGWEPWSTSQLSVISASVPTIMSKSAVQASESKTEAGSSSSDSDSVSGSAISSSD